MKCHLQRHWQLVTYIQWYLEIYTSTSKSKVRGSEAVSTFSLMSNSYTQMLFVAGRPLVNKALQFKARYATVYNERQV